jgi:hypothetical protein
MTGSEKKQQDREQASHGIASLFSFWGLSFVSGKPVVLVCADRNETFDMRSE